MCGSHPCIHSSSSAFSTKGEKASGSDPLDGSNLELEFNNTLISFTVRDVIFQLEKRSYLLLNYFQVS